MRKKIAFRIIKTDSLSLSLSKNKKKINSTQIFTLNASCHRKISSRSKFVFISKNAKSFSSKFEQHAVSFSSTIKCLAFFASDSAGVCRFSLAFLFPIIWWSLVKVKLFHLCAILQNKRWKTNSCTLINKKIKKNNQNKLCVNSVYFSFFFVQ